MGKATVVAFDGRTGQTTTWPNQPEALAGFAATLDASCLVVCEATGGYGAALLHALAHAGHAAHRADARKVKAFVRSFGTLGKTDAIDARALARYGQERHALLPRWQPDPGQRSQLQALVLARRDMVACRTAWSNRRQAPGADAVAHAIEPICATLDAQIKAVDATMAALVKACQPLQRDLGVLQAIHGIGRITATAVLALMPELGRLSGKQAAALAGLAPHPNQSGIRDAYRPVRGGRPDVRSTLFMAALSASRSHPTLAPFYQRLLNRGKKPIVAITAVMRKLIVICNARLRDAAAELS